MSPVGHAHYEHCRICERACGRWPDAIEVDRVVPASGNMTVGPQQFWLGPARAGQQIRFWIDTASVHLSTGGWRIKTVPSRLTGVDLARLRLSGGRPAGPPPAGPAPGALAPAAAWKWTGWSMPAAGSRWAIS